MNRITEMTMKKNLYGKNVFVTGASSGIGQACALVFAKNGCTVTGVSRNTEEKTEIFPGALSLRVSPRWLPMSRTEDRLTV